jgi:succinate---hydroxymethylglutarate CoA-transferase
MLSKERTADGWIYIACLTEKFWELLCQKIGAPELSHDTRFGSNEERMQHRDELTGVLDGLLCQYPTARWMEILNGSVPCAPVFDLRQAFESPFVKDNGKTVSIPYERNAQRRTVEFIAPPFSFDGQRFTNFTVGPSLGAHTCVILKTLGYSENELRALEEKGIIVSVGQHRADGP